MEVLKIAPVVLKPQIREACDLIATEAPLYAHMRENWNPEFYAQARGPIEIARLSDDDILRAIQQLPEGHSNVRSIPIKRPCMDYVILPPELSQYESMIQQVITYQVQMGEDMFRERHAYLTVSQGIVQPNQTQRIPGVHVDGLQAGEPQVCPPEQSYSCSFGLPTLFYPHQAYDFRGIDSTKRAYAQQIYETTDPRSAVSSEDGTLYLWDSYTPHATPVNMNGEEISRTFMRIEFSARSFEGPDAVTGTYASSNPYLR